MLNPITQVFFGKWQPVIGELPKISGKQKTLHDFKVMKGVNGIVTYYLVLPWLATDSIAFLMASWSPR
jgi:hypothetical protein